MNEFTPRIDGENRQAQPVRQRGRPLKDGKNRREDIIRASTLLFFKNGYTNTTLRCIASSADVNVALVHYYFTSKQGLYREVLNTALSSALSALKDPRNAPTSVDGIAQILTAPLYKHPALFQALHTHDVPSEAREAANAVTRRLNLYLTDCTRSLQHQGNVRGDLDPELFAQTCLDLCWAPFRPGHQGLETAQDSSAAPLACGPLNRHVEQNIRLLASAAATQEKKGTPMGPLSATSPKELT